MRWPNYCLMFAGCAALAGCATQYEPRSVWNIGGYTEAEVSPDTWRVRFDGNELLLPNQGDDYAKLRAAELCLAGQKSFMRMSQFSTDLEYLRGGGRVERQPVNASTETDSRTPYTDAMKRMKIVPATPRARSTSYVTVACVDQESADTLGAAALAQSIRQKYGLEGAGSRD